MKKYKEIPRFGVKCPTFALAQALKKEAESRGWKYCKEFSPFTKEKFNKQLKHCSEYVWMYFSKEFSNQREEDKGLPMFAFTGIVTSSRKTFHLVNDWGDVMKMLVLQEIVETKFKKGDKVEIIMTDCHNFKMGEVVEIVKIPSAEDDFYHAVNPSGFSQALREEQIKKYEPPVYKFKVGDKVEIVDTYAHCFPLKSVVEIEELMGPSYSSYVGGWIYRARDNEGTCQYLKEEHIAPAPAFKGFKAADLKSGMVVEFRDGNKCLVLKDRWRKEEDALVSILGGSHFWPLNMWDDEDPGYKEHVFTNQRAVAIYATTRNMLGGEFGDLSSWTVVWKR